MDARKIPIVSVSSSNLRGVGYDEDTQVMVVEFHNGSKYQVLNTTKEEYDALIGADSVGKHYNQNIKPYKEVQRL